MTSDIHWGQDWRQSENDSTFLVLEWRCWWWVWESAARLHRLAEPLRTWGAVIACVTSAMQDEKIKLFSADLICELGLVSGTLLDLVLLGNDFYTGMNKNLLWNNSRTLTAHFLQVWYNIVRSNSLFMFHSCIPFCSHSFIACIPTWKLCELSHQEKGTSFLNFFYWILILTSDNKAVLCLYL